MFAVVSYCFNLLNNLNGTVNSGYSGPYIAGGGGGGEGGRGEGEGGRGGEGRGEREERKGWRK